MTKTILDYCTRCFTPETARRVRCRKFVESETHYTCGNCRMKFDKSSFERREKTPNMLNPGDKVIVTLRTHTFKVSTPNNRNVENPPFEIAGEFISYRGTPDTATSRAMVKIITKAEGEQIKPFAPDRVRLAGS